MPRKQSKAVPKGNGLILHHDEIGSGKPTMADLYQMLEERFDRMDKNIDRTDEQLDELIGRTRETSQRLIDVQHQAQQRHLATEADVEPDTKTRKRTEDAAADRAKHGDNSSFDRVDDGQTCLASFGRTTEPLFAP